MRQMGNVKNYIATLHQDSLNMPWDRWGM
jgi:hypothetical protein